MTAARDAILDAIRSANRNRAPHARQEADARIATPVAHTRPAFAGELALRLRQKLEARAASVEVLDAMEQVPAAVLRYLATHELPGRLACAPALAALPWPAGMLDLHCGPARQDEGVSVTPCLAAVAESGSVVLTSGAGSPTTLNFVPEHHLVVVRHERILRHFEDAWQLLREHSAAAGGMPRAVNVISGPSRTADVEQTIQLGAHGPRRLHVMIVGSGKGSG